MKRLIPIFSVFILLSGCMVGPKFQKTDWKANDKYNYNLNTSTTDSITSMKWWDVYKDTVLQSLIRKALEENHDMKIAASRIIEAQYVVGYNKADIFPSFSYNASGSFLNKTNSEAAESGTLLRDNFSAAGMMNWELDFWGKFRHATKGAQAQLLATEESRKALTTSMVAQVATLYFQLRSLDQQLTIARKTLEFRKESTRIITERFKGGEVPELDKYQAQSQEAITAALVPSLERQVAQTETALSILLGKNPGYIPRGLDNVSQILPVSIPAGLPSQLLSRRPDVKAAEEYWIARNEQIGVAQAQRFPSISLTGIFGAVSQDLSNITESGSLISYVMGSISGPIFNFGKNKRRVEIERQKTEQARMNYEKTVLNAFAEVENALVSVETYRREYEARNLQMESSSGAAGLSHERYDAGYTNYLEVLENDRTKLDAMMLASQALQLHLQSSVQLYKALGGGWVIK
jgi:outer membrane protein, multidrug efflux system